LRELAYLNAGTNGPLPASAVRAAADDLARASERGRARAHFEHRAQLKEQLRGVYARLLCCEESELALTSCTSDGIAQVLGGLALGPGDQIVTSDEEHPGLLGALSAAREIAGAVVREVPLAEVAQAVGASTKLVACSHVGWMSGSFAPAELAQLD